MSYKQNKKWHGRPKNDASIARLIGRSTSESYDELGLDRDGFPLSEPMEEDVDIAEEHRKSLYSSQPKAGYSMASFTLTRVYQP